MIGNSEQSSHTPPPSPSPNTYDEVLQVSHPVHNELIKASLESVCESLPNDLLTADAP